MCAGENDLSEHHSPDEIVQDFSRLVSLLEEHSATTPVRTVLFLGPKFEPWQDLSGGAWSKFAYQALSKKLQAYCQEHKHETFRLLYVDCLTMFCHARGESDKHLHHRKADAKYFAEDQLHLSREGYQKWQRVMNEIIASSDQ